MIPEDKHIEQIYKKVLIQRQQPPKPKTTFSKMEVTEWLLKKINELFDKLGQLWSNPKTPRKAFDDIVREFGKNLDSIILNLDFDVIKVLVLDEERKRHNKKIMEA